VKAGRGGGWRQKEGNAMNDEDVMRERLSALADGELVGLECHETLAYARTEQGQASWQAYHVIGDVMRGVPAVPMLDTAMLERLRGQIAQEVLPLRPGVASAAVSRVGRADARAANASVMHWKLAAGFASLTAAVALGWTAYAGFGPRTGGGTQIAVASPAQGAAMVVDGHNVIRDPRLDKLIRQTGRYGGSSQMTRDSFLRNASLEAPPKH